MAGSEMGDDAGLPDDFVVPDDLGAMESVDPSTVALLTPIPNGKVLAAICALNGIEADVIETPAGAFAVVADMSPESTDEAAESISAFVKDRPILAMERRAGHVTIHQWTGGVKGDAVSPGLALNNAPTAIEHIMLGIKTIAEIVEETPERVHSGRMGRFEAFRALRKLAKQAKKDSR